MSARDKTFKIILTGATGAAGLSILRSAIADPAISHITVISRRDIPSSIPSLDKVTRIAHNDFSSYPPDVLSKLAGHDALVWALGISSMGKSEAEYMRITRDFPVAALRALDEAGVRGEDGVLRMVYLSGEGADTNGKSRVMFGKVKGLAEKDLTTYGSKSSSLQVYNIRPAYFPTHPADAATARSMVSRIVEGILGPIVLTLLPSKSIPVEGLARFMLEAAKGHVAEGPWARPAFPDPLHYDCQCPTTSSDSLEPEYDQIHFRHCRPVYLCQRDARHLSLRVMQECGKEDISKLVNTLQEHGARLQHLSLDFDRYGFPLLDQIVRISVPPAPDFFALQLPDVLYAQAIR
ncbi:hypothetical protein EW145_g3785 [Phellinidium pouzarii]|uniref:Uncharacterized protein n=1 Tax=Phellinidium pouzarii TaxID=167371 RepID=A0A4V3XCR1_9AGAM|nr:hypothetical protein EW145_g3785 [Phellinidium pouzarii]